MTSSKIDPFALFQDAQDNSESDADSDVGSRVYAANHNSEFVIPIYEDSGDDEYHSSDNDDDENNHSAAMSDSTSTDELFKQLNAQEKEHQMKLDSHLLQLNPNEPLIEQPLNSIQPPKQFQEPTATKFFRDFKVRSKQNQTQNFSHNQPEPSDSDIARFIHESGFFERT